MGRKTVKAANKKLTNKYKRRVRLLLPEPIYIQDTAEQCITSIPNKKYLGGIQQFYENRRKKLKYSPSKGISNMLIPSHMKWLKAYFQNNRQILKRQRNNFLVSPVLNKNGKQIKGLKLLDHLYAIPQYREAWLAYFSSNQHYRDFLGSSKMSINSKLNYLDILSICQQVFNNISNINFNTYNFRIAPS